VTNAIEAMKEGGNLRLQDRARQTAPVTLEVSDSGPRIFPRPWRNKVTLFCFTSCIIH